MKVKSGRTAESHAAIQELVDFLEQFGEIAEEQESVFRVNGQETMLVLFNSFAYFQQKGYYWFSLPTTKYMQMHQWPESHSWMVLLCGGHGRFFVPIAQIKSLLARFPSNRKDGRWDLYIRFENDQAYLGVTKAHQHLNVTDARHRFESLWQRPDIAEEYQAESLYIPDSLPEPDRRMGQVLRVVRDTKQSRFVKELYEYHCQVCGMAIYAPKLKSVWYCEAHHLQPLGRRYSGPDHASNIVALCPNHHSMMDLGVLAIDPINLTILARHIGESTQDRLLTLRKEHGLNQKYLQFHLDKIFAGGDAAAESPLVADFLL